MAMLPGATAEELATVLNPFYRSLAKLNVSLTTNEVSQQSNFMTHFKTYNSNNNDARNMTIGNQLIPRSVVNNPTSLTHLMDAFRTIVEVDNSTSDPILVLLSSNVTHATAGNKPSHNSVLPAWRDSFFSINLVLISSEYRLRKLTRGGGCYASEAVFGNKHWKTDCYGINYDRLLRIKSKYDPGFVL